MQDQRPWVQLACICEKVIEEKDGVLSVIRIVDTFLVPEIASEDKEAKARVSFSTIVALKSGGYVGQGRLDLTIHSPSGETKKMVTVSPVALKGGHHGANFVVKSVLLAKDVGSYRIDVIWEGEVLTSVPFSLRAEATSSDSSETNGSAVASPEA